MSKKLDLSRTIYELTQEYPELIEILSDLGFVEITKKEMLHSAGRIMTIPKGAGLKNIPMMDVVSVLISNGYELAGEMPVMPAGQEMQKQSETRRERAETRTDKIKNYLHRLGEGEDLEAVRGDFAREFRDVEAEEIMAAEQELLREGTPLAEVQRLCDLHSALFHGTTREEKAANAKNETEAAAIQRRTQEEIAKRDSFPKKDYRDKKSAAAELESITGHPLSTFTKENAALSDLLEEFQSSRNEDLIPTIRELSVHYAKKGDLLYPLLKVKYGVSGPSDVMWTVDDEIRDELNDLDRASTRGEAWNARLDAVLNRAGEMVYKEQNILFPICAVNFTEEEWHGIYHDSKDYAVCFGVAQETWEGAERPETVPSAFAEDEVVMPGGHMSVAELTALLNTIPLEITFVDADNINRFFNEGPKVFKRPGMAIDREVFSCHPPKIEPMVRQIINDFRSGRRDEVPIWMEKNGRLMLVKYMAVRDREGTYLGTVELVQDMEFAKKHLKGSSPEE